jgi:hypothetical protein
VLRAHGEPPPIEISAAELDSLRQAALELREVFTAGDVAVAADRINGLLAGRAHPPRLTAHGGASGWHLHVDSDDDAPWGEWFLTSSCLALAVLLAERQAPPAGICASPSCGRPFVNVGRAAPGATARLHAAPASGWRRTGKPVARPGHERLRSMEYAHLGRSGLSVSRLCLGTMNFGPLTPPGEAHAIMDHAHEIAGRARETVEQHREQIAAYEDLCGELGEEPANVALAWLLHQEGVTGPIIGPRTVGQLDDAQRAVTLDLDDDVLKRLDDLFPGYRPAPEHYAW